MFVEEENFTLIKLDGSIKESTSEEDNRMSKVQEVLSEKYQNENYSFIKATTEHGARKRED